MMVVAPLWLRRSASDATRASLQNQLIRRVFWRETFHWEALPPGDGSEAWVSVVVEPLELPASSGPFRTPQTYGQER